MPIIKSAKKRVRVAHKATVRNVKTKRTLKAALKAFHASLTGTKSGDAQRKAQSALDKAGKKGVLHKNKVARKKRQLAIVANKAGVKITTKSAKASPVKKAMIKKPASKAPAKKKN